jgi:hypothetical protein
MDGAADQLYSYYVQTNKKINIIQGLVNLFKERDETGFEVNIMKL